MKTITITEEAYENIKGLKMEGESFSELFKRISAGKSTQFKKLFGILKVSEKEASKRRAEVLEGRERLSEELEASMNDRARYVSNN